MTQGLHWLVFAVRQSQRQCFLVETKCTSDSYQPEIMGSQNTGSVRLGQLVSFQPQICLWTKYVIILPVSLKAGYCDSQCIVKKKIQYAWMDGWMYVGLCLLFGLFFAAGESHTPLWKWIQTGKIFNYFANYGLLCSVLQWYSKQYEQ